MTKETYHQPKEPHHQSNETVHQPKEPYHKSERDLIILSYQTAAAGLAVQNEPGKFNVQYEMQMKYSHTKHEILSQISAIGILYRKFD